MLYPPTLEMLKCQLSELIGQLGGQKHEWFQILPGDFCSDMQSDSILPDTTKKTTVTSVSQKLNRGQKLKSLRKDRSLKKVVLNPQAVFKKRSCEKLDMLSTPNTEPKRRNE